MASYDLLRKHARICLRVNAHAKSLFEKDMTLFWKDIKNNYDTRLPLAPMVDKCIGEKDVQKFLYLILLLLFMDCI